MHEGHRKRIIERLDTDENGLQDHELLEILLFNAIPRKNTNELAHALLQRFGSLAGISRADYRALLSVEGLGESAAAYLRCLSLLYHRVKFNPKTDYPSTTNFCEFSGLLIQRLRGLTQEFVELYATDKKGGITGVERFTSNDKTRVKLDPKAVAEFFARHRPEALVIAHNHLTECSDPSASDDLFTKRMMYFCEFYGIPLFDHIIVSEKEVYSYFAASRFDLVKELPFDPASD